MWLSCVITMSPFLAFYNILKMPCVAFENIIPDNETLQV